MSRISTAYWICMKKSLRMRRDGGREETSNGFIFKGNAAYFSMTRRVSVGIMSKLRYY